MSKSQATEQPDIDQVHKDALGMLQNLKRDYALSLACSVCTRPEHRWLAKAEKAKTIEARCAGLFKIENPDRPDLKWPAVVFLVRTPYQAALFLYWGADEKWTVNVELPVEQADGSRKVVISPEQYAGNPDGPPGLLNGDAVEEVSRERPAVAPASPPAARPDTASESRTPSRSGADLDTQAPPVARRKTRPSSRKPARTPQDPPPPSGPALEPRMELVLRLLRLLDS